MQFKVYSSLEVYDVKYIRIYISVCEYDTILLLLDCFLFLSVFEYFEKRYRNVMYYYYY